MDQINAKPVHFSSGNGVQFSSVTDTRRAYRAYDHELRQVVSVVRNDRLSGRETLRLLLTSAGIKNESIRASLLELLGKPIAESSALIIPTAIYAFPGGAQGAWKIIAGRAASPLCEIGWKSIGVLELTALPSINREHWVSAVEQADALLVSGGDPLYLCYWMRQSGLADLLPTLAKTVYVGVSAGSLVIGPCIGGDIADLSPLNGGDSTLGLVDFAIFPHLDHPDMPDFAMIHVEQWASGLSVPGYAIDDETAIKVVDGVAEVVSEGHWRLMTPATDCG